MKTLTYNVNNEDIVLVKINKSEELYSPLLNGDLEAVDSLFELVDDYLPESFADNEDAIEINFFNSDTEELIIFMCLSTINERIKNIAIKFGEKFCCSEKAPWIELNNNTEEEIKESSTERCYELALFTDVYDIPISTGSVYYKNGSFYLKTNELSAMEFLKETHLPGDCELIADVSKMKEFT